MAVDYDNPLTDEHLQCCNNVLASTAPALNLAQKCKDCGWPVDDMIDQLKAQQTMATTIKQKFFPMQS